MEKNQKEYLKTKAKSNIILQKENTPEHASDQNRVRLQLK